MNDTIKSNEPSEPEAQTDKLIENAGIDTGPKTVQLAGPTSNKSEGSARPVGISIGMAVAISVLSSVITAGGLLVAYDYYIAQKIVAVDIKGFIAQTRDEFLAGKITDLQMRAGFDRMESVVKSIPKNKVVLMGDAVIQGVKKIEIGPNVTEQQLYPQ